MPTAIMLTRANIDLISETLGLSKKDVSNEWLLAMQSSNPQPYYYVRDVLYMESHISFLIYNHREFLDDFASIPPGIEERFVTVTQVKP